MPRPICSRSCYNFGCRNQLGKTTCAAKSLKHNLNYGIGCYKRTKNRQCCDLYYDFKVWLPAYDAGSRWDLASLLVLKLKSGAAEEH